LPQSGNSVASEIGGEKFAVGITQKNIVRIQKIDKPGKGVKPFLNLYAVAGYRLRTRRRPRARPSSQI